MKKTAKADFAGKDARADDLALAPLPNSRKIYATGSRPDLRVPMRAVSLSLPAAADDDDARPLVRADGKKR